MKRRNLTFRCAASALVVPMLAAVPSTAFAQSEPSSATDAVREDVIVVTARRVGEDIAKVPTAVTAIRAEALQAQGINQQADLQAAVPGLTVRETQSNNQLNYAIRGQTVDAFSGSSTAVVSYVNEVPFIAGGVASFFDLESIQVLKGPQGTLFGRNATGGAVLSTTAKPRFEFSGFVKASYGNYDWFNSEGALNVPIIDDTIAFRAAFKIDRRDGYIKNVFDGPVYGGNDNSELGKLYSNAFRASLLISPGDTFENLTVFQYERTKGNNSGTRLYSINRCGDTSPQGVPLVCGADAFFDVRGALDRQQNELGFWEVNGDSPSFHRGKDWFITNSTTVELGENITLKNVFGYSDSNAVDSTEQTGEPFALITNYDISRPVGITEPRSYGNEVGNKSISEELQLQGNILNGGLEYILGGYYQKIKNHTEFPQTYFGGGAFTTSHWKSVDETKAVFGHLTFDLGDLIGLNGLKFSAGGRYAWEKITLEHQPGGTFFGLQTEPFKDDRASWNLGLEYQATSDLMLYIVARESWRSGGINGVAPPFLVDDSANVIATNVDKFKSEVAQDFEAGFKYSGELGGHPAHVFLAAYTMEVKNIQRVLFPDNPFTASPDSFAITVNIPKARIKGLELEAGIKPTDWLDLGFTAAYTKAKYTEPDGIVFQGTPQQLNYQFGPFADTPKWTGSAYAAITLPVSEDIGRMTLRGDFYVQSKFFFSNLNNTVNPGTELPGYETVNLRFDWREIAGSGFGVGAYVRNLTNEKYYVGGLPLGLSLGVNSGNVGRPRMYGFEVSYRF